MKSYIEDVINAAAVRDIKTATKYISEMITVKATKRCVKKLKTEFVVTIGKPNFKEREFIKLAKKSGEPFPIKKIQLIFKKEFGRL